MKTVSRTSKHKNQVNTILYEIGMLEYCYERICKATWSDKKECNLVVEGFLLHYRNLIEFFGSHGDLKANEPHDWSPRSLSPKEVRSIQDNGPYKDYRSLISRYLSHCDSIRAEKDRGWNAEEMYARIEPVMKKFLTLFPPEPETREVVFAVSAADAHTASISTQSVFSTKKRD